MDTNTQPRVPEIIVPDGRWLAEEPARTIGEMFADKTMIRPLIAAIVAMISVVTGWIAADEVIDNLTTIVTTVAVIYAAWSAQHEASTRASAQAEATRQAVYAPATVKQLVADAATSKRGERDATVQGEAGDR